MASPNAITAGAVALSRACTPPMWVHHRPSGIPSPLFHPRTPPPPSLYRRAAKSPHMVASCAMAMAGDSLSYVAREPRRRHDYMNHHEGRAVKTSFNGYGLWHSMQIARKAKALRADNSPRKTRLATLAAFGSARVVTFSGESSKSVNPHLRRGCAQRRPINGGGSPAPETPSAFGSASPRRLRPRRYRLWNDRRAAVA